MRGSALLLALLLAACTQARPASSPANALTLCIQNATAGYGNVVALIERTRYEVRPGQTSCRQIAAAGTSARLSAHTTAGGERGQLQFATTLPSAGVGCYRWRLAGPQSTQGDLLPCEGEQGQ
jgi:hypothetical protein